jgi:hypothetical protein
MNIYAVTVHETVHTCPGNLEPHAIDTRRAIVHTTRGRSCLAPVTIRVGEHTATVACGRHEPHDRQCGACRTVVNVLSATCTDLGYQGPAKRAPGNEEPA